jgi:hypothetical protein
MKLKITIMAAMIYVLFLLALSAIRMKAKKLLNYIQSRVQYL